MTLLETNKFVSPYISKICFELVGNLTRSHLLQIVILLVRTQSVEKPIVQEFRNAGAQVRVGDISETPEKIVALLQGVDILISLVLAMSDQKPLLLAKKAGVNRAIPSDFGPHAPRVMSMHDTVGSFLLEDYASPDGHIETRHPRLYQGTRLAIYVYRSGVVAPAIVPIPACHASERTHSQDLHRGPSAKAGVYHHQIPRYICHSHYRRPAYAQPDSYRLRWRNQCRTGLGHSRKGFRRGLFRLHKGMIAFSPYPQR